tara:strand:+ start:143436 stop:144095 length:660 start_codon:yes stop_codon:yes gene_type:complete
MIGDAVTISAYPKIGACLKIGAANQRDNAAWDGSRGRAVGSRPISARSLCLKMIVLVACSATGCAGYQFGSASLFRPGIRTVHVPIVRNETFRHDLGIRLTEAIVKEVERRTPYKIVSDPNADSILTCTISNQTKQVLTETENDDPRALDTAISVRATWTDRQGQLLMQNSITPVGDGMITFGQDARFVPEAGQSIDTANQAAIENLAERIVSQMEMRW